MTQSPDTNQESAPSLFERLNNARRTVTYIGIAVLVGLFVLAAVVIVNEDAPTPQALQPNFDGYHIVDDEAFVLDFIDEAGNTFSGVFSAPVDELINNTNDFLLCLVDKEGFDLRVYMTEGAQGEDGVATVSEALRAPQRGITAIIDWNRTSASAFDCALGERNLIEAVVGALSDDGFEDEFRFCTNSIGFQASGTALIQDAPSHQYTFGYIGIGGTICDQLDDQAEAFRTLAAANTS